MTYTFLPTSTTPITLVCILEQMLLVFTSASPTVSRPSALYLAEPPSGAATFSSTFDARSFISKTTEYDPLPPERPYPPSSPAVSGAIAGNYAAKHGPHSLPLIGARTSCALDTRPRPGAPERIFAYLINLRRVLRYLEFLPPLAIHAFLVPPVAMTERDRHFCSQCHNDIPVLHRIPLNRPGDSPYAMPAQTACAVRTAEHASD
ncbi:hypothetical protein C8Q70DRAFT_314668 [Cubamyces menziesii]|nr:hypothetical protein C8Q70DRAFT_314668 [Cubamyces menziesii]